MQSLVSSCVNTFRSSSERVQAHYVRIEDGPDGKEGEERYTPHSSVVIALSRSKARSTWTVLSAV
jgi:hypothetical protein